MGWKNIKEHYDIKHAVCVSKERNYGNEPVICIGSAFVHDIIVISMKGKLLKRYTSGHTNELLRELQPRLDEDEKNGKLRELIEAEDTFNDLKTVYWVGDYKHIVAFQCEEYGWPNCTTDGRMMYENTFTPDLETARMWLLHRSKISPFFWEHIRECFSRAWDEVKRIKYEFSEVWQYIYVRLWGRYHIVKGSNKYD